MNDGGIPVVEYIRVSDPHQAEEGMGLEVQHESNQAFAARKGFVILKTFEEPGFTAATFERPAYQQLKEYVREHPDVKGLVLDRQSRLSRSNIYDVGQEIKEFQKLGLFIAFSAEDSILGAHEFLEKRVDIGIRALLAALDNAEKAETVTRHMHRHAREGHWLNKPPFGYRLVPCPDCGKGKKLAPNDQGHIITEIAQRFDSGQSSREIREWLLDRYGLTVEGETLKWWLTNPAYCGDVVYNRRSSGKYRLKGKHSPDEQIVCPDAHPALVPREIWERIQQRFDSREGTYEKRELRPLDGLVFCGLCGEKMYRKTLRRYSYYFCSTRHRFNNCEQAPITVPDVEGFIEREMEARFTSNALASDFGRRYAETLKGDLERFLSGSADTRARLRREITKLQRQQDEAYRDRLERRVPVEVANRALARIETQLEAAQQELTTLKTEHTAGELKEITEGFELWLNDKLDAFGPFFRREIARMFIARVRVRGREEITIEWTAYAQNVMEDVAKVKEGTCTT